MDNLAEQYDTWDKFIKDIVLPWDIRLEIVSHTDDVYHTLGALALLYTWMVPDRNDPAKTVALTRYYVLNNTNAGYGMAMPEDMMLHIIHLELEKFVIHEANENFYYKGERIFDPHKA